MFITKDLKEMLEKHTEEWMDLYPTKYSNVHRPFSLDSLPSAKILYKLINDKLEKLALDNHLDDLLKPFKPNYYGYTNGYYSFDKEKEYFDKLELLYHLKKNIIVELHRYVIYAPLMGNIDTRIWTYFLNSLTRVERNFYDERQAQRISDFKYRLINLQSLPLKLAYCFSKVNSADDYVKLRNDVLVLLYIAPIRYGLDWTHFYMERNETYLSILKDVWNDIYPDYKNNARNCNRRILNMAACIASEDEFKFLMDCYCISSDQIEYMKRMTTQPSRFWKKHIDEPIKKCVIRKDFMQEKSFLRSFEIYYNRNSPIGYIGEPNNTFKDAIGLFLGYPSWDDFCKGKNYIDNGFFEYNFRSSSFSAVAVRVNNVFKDVKNGDIVRVEFTQSDVESDLYRYGLPSYLYLMMLRKRDYVFKVIAMDGNISGMKVNHQIRLYSVICGEPLRFESLNDDYTYTYTTTQTADAFKLSDVMEFQSYKEVMDETSIEWADVLKTCLEIKLSKLLNIPDLRINDKKIFSKICKLLKEEKVNVSRQTLGRFFNVSEGYFDLNKSSYVPNQVTLDELSIFLGYKSWADFLDRYILHSKRSSFKIYKMSDLQLNTPYRLQYFPHHKLDFIIIDNEGQRIARINAIEGSKLLREGDIFTFDTIQISHKLRFESVIRGNQLLNAYDSGCVQDFIQLVTVDNIK